MDLSNLKPPKGATRKRKRVGRGPGSGLGKTAGRGAARARSRARASQQKRGFEGGQMPLHRRMPKRGFHNPFRVEYAVVNLDDLAARFAAGTVVTPELLRETRPRDDGKQTDQGAGARRDRHGADGAGAQVQRQGGGEDRGGRRLGRDAPVAAGRLDTVWLRASRTSSPSRTCASGCCSRSALLGVYRIGNHIPTPGVNTEALATPGRAGQEHHVRAVRHVLGRQPVEGDDLRAGHHALHQRVDHPAAADRGLAVPRDACRRKASWAAARSRSTPATARSC